MMKFIILLLFSKILSGQFLQNQQSNVKCGIFPENDNQIIREYLNWGYGYDSLLVDLERWNGSPYVTIDSLGATVQNRTIWELTISENSESETYNRIYIHARTHPGEEESFWVTNEIINILISETPLGEFIRTNCIFHIVPMYNPDGVELGYARENANGIDIESGWDDVPLEPEVAVLKNRFIELMATNNPVEVALNMHSAYFCKRYFVYHAAQGTSYQYTLLEQQFINGVQSYFPDGIESWDYFVSWTNGTPDQYPESWWWMNHGENVMALTYEDMNCEEAGEYDSTANAIVRGVADYLGLEYSNIANDINQQPILFELYPNFPNPFNGKTNIYFRLMQDSFIQLKIYDVQGKHIKTLLKSYLKKGYKSLQWYGTNKYGENVPAGVYLYSLSSGSLIDNRKLIYLK